MNEPITLEPTIERDPKPSAKTGPPLLVMQQEWRLMRRDRSLALVAALLAVLGCYGLYNGATWIRSQERAIADAGQQERERLRSLQEQLRLIEQGQGQPARFRDPGRPGWVGQFLGERYAVLPPGPLAALSVGQRDLYPYYFRVSTLSAYTFLNEDEIENPFNLLAGRFDPAFVITWLFPLVILAFSYNLLSQEKESGTLALALAQPVRLKQVVIGKVLARVGLVVTLAVLLSLVGAVLGGVSLTAGVAVRLLLWTAAVVLYGLFWFALALAVNASGRGSASQAVALACLWLVLVIIVPALLTATVSWRYPVPSRLAFINAVRDEQRNVRQGVLEEFYAAHPELKPAEPDKNDFMPGFYAAQLDRDQRLVPLAAQYDEQLARQYRLAARLRFLSPALVVQAALDDLADTGFERHARFTAQVHAFHRRWQEFFLPKLFSRTRLTSGDYELLPKFNYEQESLAAVCRRCAGGLVGLSLLTAALTLAAFRGLRRFRVAG